MDVISIVFIIVAALSLLIGLVNGLADQIFRVIGGVVSIALAVFLCDYPAKWLMDNQWILDENIAKLVGGLLVMFVCCLLFGLIGWAARKLLKVAKPLNVLDKILGLVFAGAVVYCVFGAVYFFAGVTINAGEATDIVANLQQFVSDSMVLNALYGQVNPIGQLLAGFMA